MKKHEPVYVLSPYSRLVAELGVEEANKEMARRSAMRKNKVGGFNDPKTQAKALKKRVGSKNTPKGKDGS